ncbi:MAG TPA: 1-deoxy-D-xylulose-5-phosphate synthase [Clostridiales bacterium]|nr:1-deoxy-D-xylulose-5-phosphate synthase [Clostridiales bacterium]HBL80995.1 1-deoxy-D-xylulose-5-phosphate synthase [Clostridiales bacterium]
MFHLLDRISCPEDVKKLNIEETHVLAEEIRAFLIDSVSKTGGHLASNLGVVELTIALLRAFDLPEDKIVWDVGHQSYVYKLLTGRRDKFSTLRKYGGLAGFPKTCESEFDCFNTGHSSTSISAALGIAKANILKGSDAHTVAVIGDGALSGGMATEALCDAGNLKKNFIVVLNDNNMSISKSVGGFTKHLTKLRSVPAYFTFKSRIERGLSRFSWGDKIALFLKKFKDLVKHILVGNTVFDDMGFTYFGPVDGHDVEMLTLILNRAKLVRGPVLLHVITKKGKGYKFAEKHPAVYHGVSTFEASVGISSGKRHTTYSRIAGNTLCALAERDNNICVVTAAMSAGTGTDEFAERFSRKFFDVAIAEQHAVTFAAGLAISGLKPFVVIYSSFLQRAYDQILHDVCLQNLNVTFCIDRAGIVGEDGETHHGLFDIAYMSAMPNMTVLAPASFAELEQMMRFAASGAHQGPIAIRYPRGYLQPETKTDVSPFVLGIPHTVRQGKDVCLFCAGLMLTIGEKVCALLKEHGLNPTLVNLRTLFPLNTEFVTHMAKKHKLVVTLEDGVVKGGFGESVAAALAEREVACKCLVKGYAPVVPHGSPKELKKLCRMDERSIAEEILEKLSVER